ncbi:hypothetical protein KEM54_002626 [Ascosphaera aggregata]|nr:hypothetical protein KEM54_002626 [Ascosphaera aggregata]
MPHSTYCCAVRSVEPHGIRQDAGQLETLGEHLWLDDLVLRSTEGKEAKAYFTAARRFNHIHRNNQQTQKSVKMQFSLVSMFCLASAALAAPASILSVTYDRTFDNAHTPISTLACSDGENGLLNHGWTFLGQVPSFPRVAGISAISGWNSPNCGTCWKVTYNGTSVRVLGVDVAGHGVNMGLKTMNRLTNHQAESLGEVQATVEQVHVNECGL